MDLFDTHTHLCDAQFDSDRDAALARARDAGVTRIMEIADEPGQWEPVLALARAKPHVRASLGLHPYYAEQCDDALIARLEMQAALPEVVAIGEIGLDYVKGEAPKDAQRAAFERLLDCARQWDKPAVVHCRGAYEDLLPIMRNIFPAPPPAGYWGVVHCFSGGEKEAVTLGAMGFALGADGPVTYPKNDALRGALKAAGAGVVVLETDSPYLPPQSSRGKRNEPRAIPEIAAKMAEVLGLSPEETARVTTANALRLFRLSAA